MPQIEYIDVLIIGSGPAGISTALHLVKADPEWATRLVVVEKAVHPREKPCGGGVTQIGEQVLTGLGLSFERAHIPIREVRIVYHNRVFAIRDNPVFRVVRRAEFDHWLVQQGEQRGIEIRQDEAVTAVVPHTEYVEVITERRTFHAKTVVAADGSLSFVRKMLQFKKTGHKARLLEMLTPGNAEEQPAFHDGIAVFDFSPMSDHVQGYCWDFPSLIAGKSVMNRGIFDSRIVKKSPQASLKSSFQQALKKRNRQIEHTQLTGFPIQCFDRHGEFSKPRILLAGDAAGVDPLFGEGISFALAYGEVAADTIIEAFARQDFHFSEYKNSILAHPILRQLGARAKVARLAYWFSRNPYLVKWLWKFVPLTFRGLVWYRPKYVPVNQPRLLKIES